MTPKFPARALATLCALAGTAMIAAGCGSSESSTSTEASDASGSEDLTAVKDYLTDHADALQSEVSVLSAAAEDYYALAEEANFDYETLMKENCEEVAAILSDSRDAFVRANPDYEEMEGIVAGVPRLAQYDVDIDAGSDASDPESAVSFSLELPNGETMEQPGNLFFLTETALFGTNPDLLADVRQDADCDGKVEFGEGIPDAEIYVATLREFQRQADSLQADAAAFEPTPSDALTAITIMTPTMSEYFEAWKNSAFIAGSDAKEQGFVATSRLSDIADILEGIIVHLRRGRADDRHRRPAGRRADQAAAQRAPHLRRGPARSRGGRREVHRRGRRHARLGGPGPRRGDRRSGDAGRAATGNRAPGRVTGERWNPRTGSSAPPDGGS